MGAAKNIVREQLRPSATFTPGTQTGQCQSLLALVAFRALASGIFGSLAAAEPRAAAARFRRLPTTILGPRRASPRLCSPRRETLKDWHDAESVS